VKDKLKILLRAITDFDEAQLDKIVFCFKPKSIKRNSIILHEGEICKEFYFIHKGCIRTYFIDKNGHEKTRYVMLDCSIGTALTSFISQKPSFEFIEALEDSELLVISHQDFYRLNNEIDNWKIFYQRILEMAYSFQNRKIEALVTLTAKERYDQLLKENPAFIQRLSNKVLASYLDVREETLSRLKSK
jgi:CRP-like cAMP-binding protein